MKKTNLALAIFAAIAVAACGGSSSNDDAPVDKKPETPVTPVKPTTGGNETPETPKTPEETKPETPAVAGGGAGGAGAGDKTDGEKPKEKKPENAGGGGGHGGGSSFPQDPKGAAAAVKQIENQIKRLDIKIDDAGRIVAAKKESFEEFETKHATEIGEIKDKIKNKQDLTPDEKELKAQYDELQQAYENAQIEEEMAKDEQTALKGQELAAQVNEARVKKEPAAVVDEIQAKLDVHNATQDLTAAKLAVTEAGKNHEDFEKGELAELRSKAETAQKNYANAKTEEERNKANSELTEANRALDEGEKKLQKLTEKQQKAQTAKDEAQTAFDDAEKALETAKKAAPFRGQSGTVEDMAKVQKVQPPESAESQKWIITLDGEKPFAMDLADSNKKSTKIKKGSDDKYGYFGHSHFGVETDDDKNKKPDEKKPEVKNDTAYAIFVNESDNAGFGYIDGTYYHFGVLTDPKDVLTSADTATTAGKATYNGTAFVVTKPAKADEKGVQLVATVTANADFKAAFPSLKGSFKEFKTYLKDDGKGGQELDDVKAYDGDIDALKASNATGVEFIASIKEDAFESPDDSDKANAKVKGNFYGTNAENIGGLVDHTNFYGSFGGKAETE